jgi:hypothetical protein
VALDNIQRKSQALVKTMQKADRKFYFLPLKEIARPLNGNCSTIMKPKEFPAVFDESQKYSPDFSKTEAGAMSNVWKMVNRA